MCACTNYQVLFGISPFNSNNKASVFLEVREAFFGQHFNKPASVLKVNHILKVIKLQLSLSNEERIAQNIVHDPPLSKSHHPVLLSSEDTVQIDGLKKLTLTTRKKTED